MSATGWVLIILLVGGPTSIPFTTNAQCEAAASWVKTKYDRVSVKCFPAG